ARRKPSDSSSPQTAPAMVSVARNDLFCEVAVDLARLVDRRQEGDLAQPRLLALAQHLDDLVRLAHEAARSADHIGGREAALRGDLVGAVTVVELDVPAVGRRLHLLDVLLELVPLAADLGGDE